MNLARKWRSKYFDEIVGQALVVRLVKNSLFRNTIAPAYLLAGTHGCGKTSIARIFAAALNCHALTLFQKNPQEQQIPCLECASCKAMQAGSHPDFIEIDAASHTGVDNVRQIIEAASFVPVLGGKKIYLIDEAHMLSKAAFNAFLKILEEPPHSVVFMLATTDVHKIIDTVSSRCFHLFFEPIPFAALVSHLAFIATQEKLPFEEDALHAIAHESGGSLRDALNLLEQLRIGYDTVTKKSVLELLGTVDDERVCQLVALALEGAPAELLQAYKELGCKTENVFSLWKKTVSLLHECLLMRHGLKQEHALVTSRLEEAARRCSHERLLGCLELCYSYEPLLAKSSVPAFIFETLLLKIACFEERALSTVVEPALSGSLKKTVQHQELPQSTPKKLNSERATPTTPQKPPEASVVETHSQKNDESSALTLWKSCLQEIEKLKDPLVVSIFRQAAEPSYDESTKIITIHFPEEILFFKDMFENTRKTWIPLFTRFYGEGIEVISLFTGIASKERPAQAGTSLSTRSSLKGAAKASVAPQSPKVESHSSALLKDPEKWQKSAMILDLFPGTLTTTDKERL